MDCDGASNFINSSIMILLFNIEHIPSLFVRGISGLKWMLKQRSGMVPVSRIRFLSASLGGLLGHSNAILTLQTMGPCSMFCGCRRDSTSLRVIWSVYIEKGMYNEVCSQQNYLWLTVHGFISGSMIQPGVASSKISNVSSSFSNLNAISSISSCASLRKLVKYCTNNNHKDATILQCAHFIGSSIFLLSDLLPGKTILIFWYSQNPQVITHFHSLCECWCTVHHI